MYISAYPRVDDIQPEDRFLVDGPEGTRSVKNDLLVWKIDIKNLDMFYDMYDKVGIPYQMRRNIFRGKNLGSEFTAEQKARIADGSFKGFFIGDYWETEGANSNRYRIADINYWLHTGDTECTTNHLVIVPDKGVGDPQKMNDTNVTTGGYGLSNWKQNLSGASLNIVGNFFELSSLMIHRELLTNAVTNGYPSGGAWTDTRIDLLSEPMIYGSYQITPGSTGSVTPYRYTIDKTQLALFALHPEFIVLREDDGEAKHYWLRDVVSALRFSAIRSYGDSNDRNASELLAIRPVFGIIDS